MCKGLYYLNVAFNVLVIAAVELFGFYCKQIALSRIITALSLLTYPVIMALVWGFVCSGQMSYFTEGFLDNILGPHTNVGGHHVHHSEPRHRFIAMYAHL